ncbi:MAG: hypothetical protein K6C08_10330 [Oscillospiraceae bacterium]|nr:hypothetical protein [Oscillospiraceae bacterium]
MAYTNTPYSLPGEWYIIGGYGFRVVMARSEGEWVAQATMVKGAQSVTQGVTFSESTQVLGWDVELNESVATVYAIVRSLNGDGTATELVAGDELGTNSDGYALTVTGVFPHYDTVYKTGVIAVSKTTFILSISSYSQSLTPASQEYSLNDTTFYAWQYDQMTEADIETAYNALFGYGEPEEIIIGRFSIDLATAGGGPDGWSDSETGTSGVWDEPGDVGYDDEEGETTTLYLTINGALSGRHNDPIEDTSFSYVPMDKNTTPDYGCGGDGGSGGGGGAGASTVVVRRFATGRADSKDITALAKRHGYGSGGGKGGTGGDGIILVYY